MPRINTEAFYQRAIEKYGITAEGVHWNSTQSQEHRFSILRALLPPDLTDVTLVDVGCGFGDLYLFLARQQALPKQYVGIDVIPTMVEQARIRTGCEILQCDVLADNLPIADYYLCSGAMNTLTRQETFCFIERCFHACQRGFVFNLLDGIDCSDVFNYSNPNTIVTFAQEQLGSQAVIKQGYLRDDFSVFLPRL
ncbi:class I SAM-dependent methyltransferase [Rhodopseudomonas palustris]|uniref:Class I SAM-dependent methyltransferase n=1 Tax=Thiospirillum jenense TaxID=1653858 RepID=A0A839HBY7_9GAMM|nr:class I SAM-dependent methyltransferase [Thiospirillum jenense]MBB1089698.1 class I SAM-dependent methyltransferase [Rhodopseudomonas palustris]MBB1124798.1 class I SAM-dependent methyltransferase [Thiospirillum jenense]